MALSIRECRIQTANQFGHIGVIMMEQLTIPLEMTYPKGYLPCSRRELVEGWLSIRKILNGNSGDFERCDECDIALCDHALDDKRRDHSYQLLVSHFEDGGTLNQPVCYSTEWNELRNGHHRLAAALDAGFTHIPYQTRWGSENDWEESYVNEHGFILTAE
jgi:hypothetical protein